MATTIETEVVVVEEGRLKSLLRYGWSKVKNAFKRTFTRKNITQTAVFVGSVALTYGVMQYFLPLWLNLMMISVSVIHELTHFIVAVRRKQDPRLPFFIPWVYGITSATYVDKTDPVHGQNIALAGPMAGIVVAIAWGIGSGLIGFTPGVYAAAWVLAQQIFYGTFGSDGRHYRRFGKVIATDVSSVRMATA